MILNDKYNIINMNPTLDFNFPYYETKATYYYNYATDKFTDFNNYLIENKGANYMFMFWMTVFIVTHGMVYMRVKSDKNEIDFLEKSNKAMNSVLVKVNTKNSNLISENVTLQSEKTELESKLFEAHKEIRKLNSSMNKLKDRNAILCDSLGEFLTAKRRKLNNSTTETVYNLRPRKNINYSEMIDSDTSEENIQPTEPVHNYNLREIEKVSYANMDTSIHDKNDSDYHPETK
jgi:hypothetical protein